MKKKVCFCFVLLFFNGRPELLRYKCLCMFVYMLIDQKIEMLKLYCLFVVVVVLCCVALFCWFICCCFFFFCFFRRGVVASYTIQNLRPVRIISLVLRRSISGDCHSTIRQHKFNDPTRVQSLPPGIGSCPYCCMIKDLMIINVM